MNGSASIRELLRECPALRVLDHPKLRSAASRMVRGGQLIAPLPGIVTLPHRASDLECLAAAIRLWRPDAAITGVAAARLTYLPGPWVAPIEVLSLPARVATTLVKVVGGVPKPEWVLETAACRVTHPAFTAAWLADRDNGSAIDEGLRSRAFTLSDLSAAMESLGQRPGNQVRRRVIHESRSNPWSAPERRAHAILHRHRVKGWKANYRVLVRGCTYFLDIAFPELRVAFEIDGWLFHHTPEQTLRDATRNSHLTLADWWVFRLGPGEVDDEWEFIAYINECLRVRRAAWAGR